MTIRFRPTEMRDGARRCPPPPLLDIRPGCEERPGPAPGAFEFRRWCASDARRLHIGARPV